MADIHAASAKLDKRPKASEMGRTQSVPSPVPPPKLPPHLKPLTGPTGLKPSY